MYQENESNDNKGLILITDISLYLENTEYDGQFMSLIGQLPEYRRMKLEKIKQREDWIRSFAAGILFNQGMQIYKSEKMNQIQRSHNSEAYLTIKNVDLLECSRNYDSAYNAQISVGENEKPYFTNEPGLYFNLSHSGRFVVCMISRHECGIDVEGDRKVKLSVARRFFSSYEYEWIQDADQDQDHAQEWQQRFLRLWTIREAYAKVVGTGIFKEMKQIKLNVTASNNKEKGSITFCDPIINEKYEIIELNQTLNANDLNNLKFGTYCISIVLKR